MSAVPFGDEVMSISRFHDQRDDLNAERSSSLRSEIVSHIEVSVDDRHSTIGLLAHGTIDFNRTAMPSYPVSIARLSLAIFSIDTVYRWHR